jgi:hypothetical protein
MPVTVHFTPPRATLDGDGPQRLRLTVACGLEPTSGQATLVLPPGLSAEVDGAPAETGTMLRYDLAGHGFTTWEVSLQATPGAAEGRYFVTAAIEDTAPGGGAGRTAQDAALVTVGEAGPPDRGLPPEELFFRMTTDTQALAAESDVEFPGVADPREGIALAPGERGRLRVRVVSHLASEMRGELQLISPFGTWETTAPWTRPVAVPPNGETETGFDVAVPATATPGWESWLLVKLMYFGRVRYSPAVRLTASALSGALGSATLRCGPRPRMRKAIRASAATSKITARLNAVETPWASAACAVDAADATACAAGEGCARASR